MRTVEGRESDRRCTSGESTQSGVRTTKVSDSSSVKPSCSANSPIKSATVVFASNRSVVMSDLEVPEGEVSTILVADDLVVPAVAGEAPLDADIGYESLD